ncbi:MAG: hypothetical protein C5B53_04500 [Candidatus Melainabacteria bacterium]|nr:MAG: hypothetical protein C5B53_04500 [Candidatus Melainabacteria bacterium]
MFSLETAESNVYAPRERFFKRYENEVDEYGFNPGPCAGVETFVRFFYKNWFNVQIAGLTNIPAQGSAVLFGNHSGVLPIDGCLLYDGIINYHPNPRRVRYLVTEFLLNAPQVGKALRAYGAIPPDYEIATSLLRKEELVFFYPEAESGTGKLFKNRYKLAEFHSGLVRAALEIDCPLVPIVTIGAEEIYPLLADFKPFAKLLNAPYFPVTPFFPWLPFPFNMIPLPIRIMMCVWRPFKLRYPPASVKDGDLVAEITNDIQNDIQAKIDGLLAIRTSPFKSWKMDKVNEYLKNTSSYSAQMEKHRIV